MWWLVAACALVVLMGVLLTAQRELLTAPASESASPLSTRPAEHLRAGASSLRPRAVDDGPARSAQEIVAQKVARFVQGRRELLAKLAKHFKVGVPAEYQRFLDLAEAGSWEEAQALFKKLEKRERVEAEWPLWLAVKETYGVVEQTHKWPAQQLLDYGQAVLGSLRPDMAYLAGTDAGRFIPALLDETSDGEKHIVLTQNAFADRSYLDYVSFLHGDRLKMLDGDDSQRAFQEYLADGQRRLHHDQQSPDEARQLRRGENIKVTDNRVEVSGQTAVMAINERLLDMLIQKNPGVSFAMEESFSLPSTYTTALPLGPILELRATDAQAALTPDLAAQSLDYFRATASQLAGDPDASQNAEARAAYAKQATAQANLFASRNLSTEAEQGYRIATGLAPALFDPVGQLSEFLARSGRAIEANQLLDEFAARNSGQQKQVQEERDYLKTLKGP